MHQFDANLEIFNVCDHTNKYGMKITVENVDNCCHEHAENSTKDIAEAIIERLFKVWQEDFTYKINSITQKN